MSESLGRLIRDHRRHHGLTQEAFAALLGEGVRQSEVSRLERGFVSQPHPSRLQCIARILDIPVGKLLMLTSWANPELAAPVSTRATSQRESPGPARRSSSNDAAPDARATMEDT